jgi:acetamidase/formamidase
VAIEPFLGVIGLAPAEPGRHSTGPPGPQGGNIDCKELSVGSVLYLPVAVEGALLSAGDCHARQGDGELSGLAIECPCEHVQLTVDLRDDLELEAPIAWTQDAWITFGFADTLDEAAMQAVEQMLRMLEREHGVVGRDAVALATVAVDLRVTQIVNPRLGVHAMLPHDAIRFP